jgi:hypothetical protein
MVPKERRKNEEGAKVTLRTPSPFISKADLIENKRRVGRLRDLADVEELELIPDEGGA